MGGSSGGGSPVVAQPVQVPLPQLPPEIIQAIIASQMQPVAMQPTFGANRFLTGQMGIPMTFGVDVPAYTPFQMQPGDFSSFMAVQDFSDSKNPVIPVFNPSTRTYQAVRSTPAPAPAPSYSGGD